MSPIAALRSGPACLIEGFRMLLRPGMRRFVILPLLGNIVILLLASFVLFYALDSALDRWLPEGADWLRWLLFPLFAFAILVGGLFTFSVLANLLLGPFLGLLASQVRRQLGVVDPPNADPRGFWAGLRADFAHEFRRLAYIALCLLGVFALGWIPILQLAAAPIGILVAAWLLMVEYSGHDSSIERMSLREQLAFLRQHRLAALGFGLTTMGALLVPVLNLALLPAAVAGATVWMHERRQAPSSAAK